MVNLWNIAAANIQNIQQTGRQTVLTQQNKAAGAVPPEQYDEVSVS